MSGTTATGVGRPATSPLADLAGRRILVAEDEYTIAQEVTVAFAAAGAAVLGPTATLADTLRQASSPGRIDAAVLDVNLRGEMAWPAVEALLGRGVPVVLATGYDAAAIPAVHASLPCCEKPADPAEIARLLGLVLPPRGGAEAMVVEVLGLDAPLPDQGGLDPNRAPVLRDHCPCCGGERGPREWVLRRDGRPCAMEADCRAWLEAEGASLGAWWESFRRDARGCQHGTGAVPAWRWNDRARRWQR